LGLYKQARVALKQACQINEALGARTSLAYSLINLADMYLATSDLRKARQLAEKGLQELSPSQDIFGKIFALLELGFVLLIMGDSLSAARRFSEMHELGLSHELIALAYEAKNGLAASAIMQGQLEEARRFAYEIWDYLKEHGWVGMSYPMRVYRTCAETFDALGEAENAQAVIESGHQILMEMADQINVPEWRQSFLENVPDNRSIVEMWERRKL